MVNQNTWKNSVEIVGRVSSAGEQLELPSGDTLTKFRVVVPREKPVTKTTIDTINCTVFKESVQKKALKLEVDQVVELTGQLRRRFWQTGTGTASRMEIEVQSLKTLRSA